MATAFHAEVVTPERVLFSGDADEVSLRTDEGEISFLAHHAELVAAVDITVATVSSLGTSRAEGDGAPPEEAGGELAGRPVRFAVHGGFVHVARNVVTLLAGVAERGDEIDVERARAALQAARDRLATEGVPTAPDRPAARADAGEGRPAPAPAPETEPGQAPARSGEGMPLTGARLALLAPASAAAALRRAEVRLDAAGAAGDGG